MLAVRAGKAYLPWWDPCEATRLLRYALHRRGFPHTYQSNGNGMSVLSVSAALTVWCKNGTFVWNQEGFVMTHPSDDPVGAAQLIQRHYRGPVEPEEDDPAPPTPRD